MIPQLSGEDGLHFDPDDWRPNKAQAKFLALWHSKRYPIVSAMCGWGSGKTRLIPYIMQTTHEASPGVNGAYITDSLGRGARTVGLEVSTLLEPLGWEFRSFYRGVPSPHWISPPLQGKQTIVWVLSWKRPSTKSAAANSLEGVDAGWILLDEANQMSTEEVGVAMLGRVRSAGVGGLGRVGIVGKPTAGGPWWRIFAENRGGIFFTASSRCNRQNIPAFDEWLATLSRREILENIDANPQPPVGSIFADWVPETWPKGNLAPASWRPEPWMRIMCTWDFGVRHPAALLIAHDPRIGTDGADIVFGEVMADNVSVFECCRLLRRGLDGVFPGVWPGSRPHDMPEASLPLHAVYGDRAGRNRRDDRGLTSAISDVETSPNAGGLGCRVWYTDKPERVAVLAGIKLLWRMICNNKGERRLLCTRQLWNAGSQGTGRSFARTINDYRWATAHKDMPDKTNGADHGADALRYWAINARWPADRGMGEAMAAFKTSRPSGAGIKPPATDR